jgi:hypothetical protein
LSIVLTFWMKGIGLQAGGRHGSPTGLPNWVMITCSTSLTV